MELKPFAVEYFLTYICHKMQIIYCKVVNYRSIVTSKFFLACSSFNWAISAMGSSSAIIFNNAFQKYTLYRTSNVILAQQWELTLNVFGGPVRGPPIVYRGGLVKIFDSKGSYHRGHSACLYLTIFANNFYQHVDFLQLWYQHLKYIQVYIYRVFNN